MDKQLESRRLTDDELETLRTLLIRYCATELDQWDLWRTMTPHGPAYISIARYPDADPNNGPDGWESIDERPWNQSGQA